MTNKQEFKTFLSPKTLVARFVASRTAKSAAFLALVFGLFVASKAIGYADIYPNALDRAKVAVSFGNNIGLNAIFGPPRHLDTVAGFTVWNTLGGMMIIGSIWGLLTATKVFRGEEDAGRWELLLTGQTTQAKATLQALMGLVFSLVILYVVTAITFIGVGKAHQVDFSASSGLYYALVAISSAAVFMFVGAVTSQLMPTRGRATGVALLVFILSFLARAAADISTSAQWLLKVSPLGWIEQLQPFNDQQPVWFIPIAIFIVVLSVVAVALAKNRDLGASIFRDHDTAKPKKLLLNSPVTAALRLNAGSHAGWLLAVTAMAGFFGLLTKTAAQAFSDSLSTQHLLKKIAGASPTIGAVAFLGIVFFLLMLLLMCYIASGVGAIRQDEALGFVDNIIVRPVSRLKWLLGRIFLILVGLALAGCLTALAAYSAIAHQNLGVSLHTMFLASANALSPALFILGVALLAFGAIPRQTGLITYGLIAWSFLIQLLSSGLNLANWVLDTSILHHIALAPATDPDWNKDGRMILVGLVLGIIGIYLFTRRDLATE